MADDKSAGITLYTAGTPNGWKVVMTFQELGLPYNTHRISLRDNEQKEEWYLKINPNGKIPAIVDHKNGDMTVFETGAIMLYLCDEYDKEGKLLPKDLKERYEVIQWLMFQMGGLGPMMGQANHFTRFAPEKIDYAMNRYLNESKRLFEVLDSQLAKSEWLAAGQYTIADIANFSWVVFHFFSGLDLADFPNLQGWVNRIKERDAIKKTFEIPMNSDFKDTIYDPEKLRQAIEDIRK